MFRFFKRFFKNSMIYAIGNMLNRGAGFILIPIYTRYLLTVGYGKLEILYSMGALLRISLGMMLGHALLRFYFECKNEKDKKELISTALISAFGISFAGTILLMLFSKFFASALLSNASEFYFCNILFLTLIFEITQEVPLSYLRAQEKSVFFVSISFLQLIVRISLNVFMVVKLQWGVAGVLAGNLYSAAFIWLILNLYLLYKVGLKFSSKTFQILFKYSFPLLGGSIMGILILNADRFFLKSLSGLSTLGIYAIGYKMAMIVQMFIIQPFTTAYGPFRFSIIQEENAKKIYSFIFTYFILIVSLFGTIDIDQDHHEN